MKILWLKLWNEYYGLMLNICIIGFIILFLGIVYIAGYYGNNDIRIRAIESGCPAYTHEENTALIGQRFEQGGLLTSSKEVLILDTNFVGQVTCAECHVIDWGSQ